MKDSKEYDRPIQIAAFSKRYAKFMDELVQDGIVPPPTPPEVVRERFITSFAEFTHHVVKNGMPKEWGLSPINLPEFASAKWIAEYIGKSYDSTRKKLQRLGDSHPEYIRAMESPRRGEPRLLYNVTESLLHLGEPVHDHATIISNRLKTL